MRQIVTVVRQQALAFIALSVALSGTAYAAAALKANSVTSSTVKNASLTSADIRNGSLLKEDFKAGQLPASGAATTGASGPKGDPGTKGEPGSKGEPGTNGVNGTNGLNGVNGTNGAAGPTGQTGQTGPAGSARAYGRINGAATPSIRATPPALGLGAATKIAGQEAYCITTTVGLTPANAVMLATPDLDDSLNAAGETVQVDGNGDPACPSGAFVVRTFDKNGDASPAGFSVMIP